MKTELTTEEIATLKQALIDYKQKCVQRALEYSSTGDTKAVQRYQHEKDNALHILHKLS